MKKVPFSELEQRLRGFRAAMDEKEPGWEMSLVISKVNQYYFTGTMQEGILFIPRMEKRFTMPGEAMSGRWMNPCSLT